MQAPAIGARLRCCLCSRANVSSQMGASAKSIEVDICCFLLSSQKTKSNRFACTTVLENRLYQVHQQPNDQRKGVNKRT